MGCSQVVRHQTLTLAFVGSSPAIPASSYPGFARFSYDPVAQLAEQLPFKQWVRSSNLRWVTKNKDTTTVVSLFLALRPARRALLPFYHFTAEANSAYGNSPLCSELTRDLPRAAPGGLFSSLSAPLYSKLYGVI